MLTTRVEKHLIRKSHPYFKMLSEFTHLSKNLYNHANYLVRKEFIETGNWLRYQDLDKLLKQDTDYTDYKAMPTAQTAQQILMLLDQNWKSFFKSIKDWSKNKDKYLGQPKLPKYKPKDGKMILIITGQQAKLKHDSLKFPKSFQDFTVKPRCTSLHNFEKINQARIIPRGQIFHLEIVYSISVKDELLPDNGRYMSIDLGLDNLATVVTNTGSQPFIIDGKGLKSTNQYYNKRAAHYQEIAKRMNGRFYTNRLHRLNRKRNAKLDDCLHKASHRIIESAIADNVNTIVIGRNKNWKQSVSLSDRVNQHFVGIPYMQLICKIIYKARDHGINVVLTEESDTSGTSFMENEQPNKHYYDKSRRIHRGLFISNQGIAINADVNAAFQIMKKVFPNEFSDGIDGVVLHPVRVSIA